VEEKVRDPRLEVLGVILLDRGDLAKALGVLELLSSQ
jgi:hypothetical protein